MALVAVLAVAALVGGSTVASRQEPARGYGRVLAAAKNTPQPVPDAASDRLMAVVLSRQSGRQVKATDAVSAPKAGAEDGMPSSSAQPGS
jgi:hypothetical protein